MTILRRQRHALRRAVLAVLLLLPGLLLAGAPPASAHALLRSAAPSSGQLLATAPQAVTLDFDEAVRTVPGWIRVFGSDGRRVDIGAVRHAGGRAARLETSLRPDLPPGSYAVVWRVVSDDGHAVSGRFGFTVRTPSRLPAPQSLAASTDGWAAAVSGIALTAVLVGLTVLLGTAWFVAAVRAPGAARLAGGQQRLALAAALTGLLGSVLVVPARWADWAQIPLREAVVPGAWGPQAALAATTWPGLRIAAFSAAAVLLLLGRAARIRRSPTPVLVTGVVAAGGESLSGHTNSAALPWFAVPLGILHVVAAAAWVGALPALALDVRTALARPPGRLSPAAARVAEREAASAAERTRDVVRRFGRASTPLAVVVVLTGTVQAVLQGAVLSPWLRTPWEQGLARKLAAVVVVLVAGGGAFLLGRRGVGRGLVAIVTVETVAAVAVLVLTALLVREAPARTALYAPHERILAAGSVTFTLQWRSLGDAVAAVEIDTVTRTGDAVDLSDLTLDAASVGAVPARVPVVLQPVATGQWVAPRVVLPRPGGWALELSFATVAGERRTVTAQVEVM